ncbi:NACHT domain-containing protein [Streptomyces sp. NBC_01483]|uniref:NACHT domain-containing protein n=1 Tax=Streptomyces sp. NBC_01483 TaxID=2903883 RepID=UPI002E36D82B|nr:AAA family ATPase [Streptomyces sp. NBC_01483]
MIALGKALRMKVEPLLLLHEQAVQELEPVEPRIRDFFGNLIEQHTSLFAGRQAETAQITAFIRSRGSGYVFVEGFSGFGKTSLLADLVQRNPEFHYHFVSQAYRRSGGFDPTSLVHVLDCLCEQLDASYVPGRDQVSLERHFRGLLTRPPRKPTVIVLDAIDELGGSDEQSSPDKQGSLRDLRTLLPHRLPPGMVLVFSGRSQGDKSCLDEIGFEDKHIDLRLWLEGLNEATLVELLQMAGGAATALAPDADFVSEMHQVSAGDPFYVRFLVEDAAAGRLTRQSIDRVPTGLEGYLDQQLEQLYHRARRGEHLLILGYLLKAGTLSASALIEAVPGLNWLNLDAIIGEIHRFLLVHYREGSTSGHRDRSYSPCHDRFRQYFLSRIGNGAG